jgi:hypothetical protein
MQIFQSVKPSKPKTGSPVGVGGHTRESAGVAGPML